MQTNIKCKTIQILNTYAPHMGYATNEHDTYWQELKGILQNMNKKQRMIWTTDNNGQIAKGNDNDTNNTIGPLTYAYKCEKGNGEKLAKYCKNMNYVRQTHTLYTKKQK